MLLDQFQFLYFRNATSIINSQQHRHIFIQIQRSQHKISMLKNKHRLLIFYLFVTTIVSQNICTRDCFGPGPDCAFLCYDCDGFDQKYSVPKGGCSYNQCQNYNRPIGYYYYSLIPPTDSQFLCIACRYSISGCVDCSSQSKCSQCKLPYKLNNGKCYNQDGTPLDPIKSSDSSEESRSITLIVLISIAILLLSLIIAALFYVVWKLKGKRQNSQALLTEEKPSFGA